MVSMALSSGVDAIYPLFQNYAINHYIGHQTLDTLPLFVGIYVACCSFRALSTPGAATPPTPPRSGWTGRAPGLL